MKLLALLSALALAGCAYQTEAVTADENHIAFKAGRYANPGDEATAHCAKYGKRAVLSTGTGDGYYQFACVQ